MRHSQSHPLDEKCPAIKLGEKHMKIYRQFFKDIRRYKSYLFYAAKSELKSEVADSYLNWIWWILEPFCLMLVYAYWYLFF